MPQGGGRGDKDREQEPPAPEAIAASRGGGRRVAPASGPPRRTGRRAHRDGGSVLGGARLRAQKTRPCGRVFLNGRRRSLLPVYPRGASAACGRLSTRRGTEERRN